MNTTTEQTEMTEQQKACVNMQKRIYSILDSIPLFKLKLIAAGVLEHRMRSGILQIVTGEERSSSLEEVVDNILAGLELDFIVNQGEPFELNSYDDYAKLPIELKAKEESWAKKAEMVIKEAEKRAAKRSKKQKKGGKK